MTVRQNPSTPDLTLVAEPTAVELRGIPMGSQTMVVAGNKVYSGVWSPESLSMWLSKTADENENTLGVAIIFTGPRAIEDEAALSAEEIVASVMRLHLEQGRRAIEENGSMVDVLKDMLTHAVNLARGGLVAKPF